jgi:hypothetical protein
MRWKILAMFLLIMGFTLGFLLIFVAAQPKDFVIPFELPTSSNPNLEQRFLQGSGFLADKEIQPVNKKVLENKDFEYCFVNYVGTREKIYVSWQAVNPENNDEIFVSTETLAIRSKLKLLNEVESADFFFDKQEILVKTKPFWVLIVIFDFSLLLVAILTGSFIFRFKGR